MFIELNSKKMVNTLYIGDIQQYKKKLIIYLTNGEKIEEIYKTEEEAKSKLEELKDDLIQ